MEKYFSEHLGETNVFNRTCEKESRLLVNNIPFNQNHLLAHFRVIDCLIIRCQCIIKRRKKQIWRVVHLLVVTFPSKAPKISQLLIYCASRMFGKRNTLSIIQYHLSMQKRIRFDQLFLVLQRLVWANVWNNSNSCCGNKTRYYIQQ